MNKVVFDVTSLLPQRLSGVGVYTYQLYKGLKNLGVDVTPVYKASRLFKENAIASHLGQGAAPFLDMPSLMKGSKAVLHGPDFKLLSARSRYVKILTVHDLAVFREDLLDRKFCREGQEKMKAELAKSPDGIIVPSEFVKGELLNRFPKLASRTRVVYHGCDHLLDTEMGERPDLRGIVEAPFFLYVGHIETRKNVAALVKAFEGFCSQVPGVDLVLVGKDGFGAGDVHRLIERSPAKGRIRKLGHVGASVLKALYQKTLAFVYPSLYEGFGMPIIEAMQLGTPVITSNATSTGEVAGDGAYLVDPLSLEEIAFSLKKLHSDQTLRLQLQALGRERAKGFSWIQTSRETLKIYKEF